jgi:ubiquinone/menaquinone biosynthesis C-methylase UbiE
MRYAIPRPSSRAVARSAVLASRIRSGGSPHQSRVVTQHDARARNRAYYESRVVTQHDASARNRAYYERDDVRARYRSDGGIDAAETAVVERFLPPGSAVLDLGCGNGRVALALARRGYAVEGLDISPEMVAEARVAADDLGVEARFRIGDAVSLPEKQHEFDAVVFACNGLGHLTRDGKIACLLEIKRVLRPGGVALLSLRTPYALNTMLPRLLRNVVLPRHGLRADEECEGDGDQYVQRPPLGWLVSQCREAGLDPVCVCSHRQAARGSFRKRAWRLGGQFYVVALA